MSDIYTRFIEIQNSTKETKERRFNKGEVFSPDWLVDKMCKQATKINYNKSLDLCAGYGQMTIGMLRNGLISNLNNHHFCESCPENIEKLKYVFGNDITIIDDYTKITEKYDITITNPPYSRNVDIKILTHILPLVEEVICVHPSTWVLDRKMKCKRYIEIRNKLQGKVRSMEFFNGNPVFNIGLFVPCVINHIDNNYTGPISCDYFGDKWIEQDIFEVTKFGSNWHMIVKPFFIKMKDYCEKNGSIWDHNITELPEDEI